MNKNRHKRYRFLAVIVLFLLYGLILDCDPKAMSANVSSEKADTTSLKQELDYHSIVYKNKKYVYNQKITTVLYAGIDSDGELMTSNRYTIAPRADTIELVILDNYHGVIKILAISRDTITSVERYTMNGNSRGSYDTQLGYAYAYGDGGKISCTNLTQAVSRLLGGIPIQEYTVTNNSSITVLNNMVGKVSVIVPTDDMASVYPEFQKGAVVMLDDTNADAFVRWRDLSVPFSNNSRMKRQEAFSKEFLRKFKEEISRYPDEVWKKIEFMNPYLQTSIVRNQYLKLTELVNNLTFSDTDYYYLQGEGVQGEKNEEVYLDKEKLEETIVSLFYIEDGDVE